MALYAIGREIEGTYRYRYQRDDGSYSHDPLEARVFTADEKKVTDLPDGAVWRRWCN